MPICNNCLELNSCHYWYCPGWSDCETCYPTMICPGCRRKALDAVTSEFEEDYDTKLHIKHIAWAWNNASIPEMLNIDKVSDWTEELSLGDGRRKYPIPADRKIVTLAVNKLREIIPDEWLKQLEREGDFNATN